MSDPAIIDRVELRVRDLDVSSQFYDEVIGLEVLDRVESRAELGVPDTTGRVLLVLREDPEAPPRSIDEAGLFHIAFRVPTHRALADALRRVQASRRNLTGASDHGVSHALYLDDPEGNGLEIYCDNPREEWPQKQDGSIDIYTRRLNLGELLDNEPTSTPDRALPGTDVGHIHLESVDVEKTRPFFTDFLGLNVILEVPSALFIASGDYHHHVGVNSWFHRSKPRADGSLGLARVWATIPDVTEDELLTRADALGVAAERSDDGVGVRSPDNVEWMVQVD